MKTAAVRHVKRVYRNAESGHAGQLELPAGIRYHSVSKLRPLNV